MKILFIRFSSIGDIVLTTPLVRCAKQQLKNAEIHFVTKKKFASVIEANPYIDKIYGIEDSIKEISPELKKENYDYVIDLHHNLRSLRLKNALGKPGYSFNKLNYEKWLYVHLKVNRLPQKHIIDRYFETISSLGIKDDLKGLDYFIPENETIDTAHFLPSDFQSGFHSLVLGGSYFTKQIPKNKVLEIIELSDKPLVLLGGKEETGIGEELEKQFPGKVVSYCGKISLHQSSSLIKQSQKVITSDTGLMHIAAAFKKEIHSFWGNTVPEFGMYPYLPGEGSKIHEVQHLSCRPCSKLGYKACPKKHFKCMNGIDVARVFDQI